ncbi:hypothetical protein DFAR_2130002 [Desulfarculales bacterium]
MARRDPGPRPRPGNRPSPALKNDANFYALGEYFFGAGQGDCDLACLTLGTGVGSEMIFRGWLATGALGSGGEIGHTLVEPNGGPYTYGAPGLPGRLCLGHGSQGHTGRGSE